MRYVPNVTFLIGVYAGVQHYTGHHCIAVSAVCALVYLVGIGR